MAHELRDSPEIYVRHTFADPTTIEIVGTKQDSFSICEADVLFKDPDGACWYVTVVTGPGYISDATKMWRESEGAQTPVLTAQQESPEPPKFVWNGGLADDDSVKALIGGIPLEILGPFLTSVARPPSSVSTPCD